MVGEKREREKEKEKGVSPFTVEVRSREGAEREIIHLTQTLLFLVRD